MGEIGQESFVLLTGGPGGYDHLVLYAPKVNVHPDTSSMGAALPGNILADLASRPRTALGHLPQFPKCTPVHLLREKESLGCTPRSCTRLCGSNLHGGLTRQEEVALRTLRVWIALTPAVTAFWPQQ